MKQLQRLFGRRNYRNNAAENHREQLFAEGIWRGQWGNGADTPGLHYELHCKTGGELLRYNLNGQVIGVGSWKKTGDLFQAAYTMLVNPYDFSLTGYWNSLLQELSGNWEEPAYRIHQGSFRLKPLPAAITRKRLIRL